MSRPGKIILIDSVAWGAIVGPDYISLEATLERFHVARLRTQLLNVQFFHDLRIPKDKCSKIGRPVTICARLDALQPFLLTEDSALVLKADACFLFTDQPDQGTILEG
jgi:hypothetical protein